MTKLDESGVIKIFQKTLGNKKFVSEDVETFREGQENIIVKVDTLVESTDIPPKMKLDDAARKSIVACVSDFASKGVKPEYGIISLNLPKSTSESKIRDIAKGIKSAADEFNIKILGGDTNQGKELVIHACVFGKSEKIVPRKGAKIGDLIFVTGPFGLTGAGFKCLIQKKKGQKDFVKKSLNSVFRPNPRLEFGIKCRKYFSSAMDSSDGLSTTLIEMATQSTQKFVIDKIPASEQVFAFASHNKIDPIDLIFNSGEEYEFVFTIPKKAKPVIQRIAKKLKTPIIEIGYVMQGKGVYVNTDKKLFDLKDRGWHHFKKSSLTRTKV